MSNKPKNVKRIVEYIPSAGEIRHKMLVRAAKNAGIKHPGSKTLRVLKLVTPYTNRSKLRKLFGLY